MKVSAHIFGKNISGKVFCFSPSKPSYFEKKIETIALIKHSFEQRYQSLLATFHPDHASNIHLSEFSQAYYQIMQDDSFKRQIVNYIDAGYSRVEALMYFFETDILGVMSKRISDELLGLIRLLSDDTDTLYSIPKGTILLTPSLTYADILRIKHQDLTGVILTDSTVNSHDAQILLKLSVSLAVVDPELSLFDKLVFKPPYVGTFMNNYVHFQRVDHDFQSALLA